MRPDTSNTESDAGHFAAIAGASEHIGNPVGDQEPDVAWAKALGPDPWEPWTCPACSDTDERGMQEKCRACGWRNFGWGVSE